VPNKCSKFSGKFEFEFGNELLPATLDLRHCLKDKDLVPETGIICQPKCQSPDYQTTIPLPKWEVYKTKFCDDSAEKNIEYKNGVSAEECKKFCESWPDCYYFGYITNTKVCQLPLGGNKCSPYEGTQTGGQPGDVWWWYTYDGATRNGFEFICKKDGKWNAKPLGANPLNRKQLPNKKSASEFFTLNARRRPPQRLPLRLPLRRPRL